METVTGRRGGVTLCLCHYLPNLSGLTLAAAEQARFLAERGYPVRVLTSRPKHRPAREVVDGIEIWRSAAPFQIAKAPVMPLQARDAWGAMRGRDLVVIHLPHPDAALLALIARLRGAKVLLHMHCSLSTVSFRARVIRAIAALSHVLAGMLAHGIQVVDRDYAHQSLFCRMFTRKLHFAPPPVAANMLIPAAGRAARADGAALRVVYVGRVARQKNLPTLLRAFAALETTLGRDVTLDLIGPSKEVIGEAAWREVADLVAQSGDKVRHLGPKAPEKLRLMYASYDLLVLPSIDRQESFGLVQVEAMAQGVPVLCSDLPGLRLPVALTGMGLLVAPGSRIDLTAAMARLLREEPPRRVAPETLARLFGAEVTCAPCLAFLPPPAPETQGPLNADLSKSL